MSAIAKLQINDPQIPLLSLMSTLQRKFLKGSSEVELDTSGIDGDENEN